MAVGSQEQPSVVGIFAPSLVEIRALVDAWTKRLLGGEPDEYSVVKIDAAASEPEDVQPHLGGMSLLADRRVILIERADEWSPSQQRSFLQMLRGLPEGVSVILTVCGEQATRRQPLTGELMDYLQRYGAVERVAKLRARRLDEWIRQRAKALGVEIAPPAVRALSDRVGPDEDRLAAELEKLATYVGEGGTITPDVVFELVPRTAEASVFALLDAVVEGSTEKALALLKEFMPPSGQEQAVARLIHMLARQLRLVWQARVLIGTGHRLERLEEVPEEWAGKLPAEANIVATVRGREWMARRLSNQARAMSEGMIVRSLREVYTADLTLKGLVERRLPPEVVAEILVSRLCMIHAGMRQAP